MSSSITFHLFFLRQGLLLNLTNLIQLTSWQAAGTILCLPPQQGLQAPIRTPENCKMWSPKTRLRSPCCLSSALPCETSSKDQKAPLQTVTTELRSMLRRKSAKSWDTHPAIPRVQLFRSGFEVAVTQNPTDGIIQNKEYAWQECPGLQSLCVEIRKEVSH